MRFSQLLVLWLTGLCKVCFFYRVETNIEDFNLRKGAALHCRESRSPKKYTCVYKDALIAGMKARRLSGILFTIPLISHPGRGQWWSSQSVDVVFVCGWPDWFRLTRPSPHPHLRPRPLHTVSPMSSLSVHVCVYPLINFALTAFCQRFIWLFSGIFHCAMRINESPANSRCLLLVAGNFNDWLTFDFQLLHLTSSVFLGREIGTHKCFECHPVWKYGRALKKTGFGFTL